MRRECFMLIFLVMLLIPRFSAGDEKTAPRVTLSPSVIPQGGLAVVRIARAGFQGSPRLTWLDRLIPLRSDGNPGIWFGFLGADLGLEPGEHDLLVEFPGANWKRIFPVSVTAGNYGTRRLTLPKKMVDLDAETLERVRQEAKTMRSIWNAVPSDPLWDGAFLEPIEGPVVGPFGRKSIINNQPRSPHSGVDQSAPKGTPVKAVNSGTVALTADHFFSGRSVVIDHGGGISSMYFHLDRILVRRGQNIKKGEIIGLVGSTGRSTGPHLHWGVRINGARVDPLRLIDLSRNFGPQGGSESTGATGDGMLKQ